MDKEKAFQHLTKSRQAILAAIQGLGDIEMKTLELEGIWTASDVLAHITSWEKTCLEPLRNYVQGEDWNPEIISDYLGWNDEQEAIWQGKTLEVIRLEFSAIRSELFEIADNLTDKQWEELHIAPWNQEGTFADMLSGLAWHEVEHTKSIRAAMAGNSS